MNKSVLDRDISVLQSYADIKPKKVNLLEYLADTSRVDIVLKIRAMEDEAARMRLKAQLPAAMISGVFSARRESGLSYHNGLICLDIDRKDNQHLQEFDSIRYILQKLPFVAYCGLVS